MGKLQDLQNKLILFDTPPIFKNIGGLQNFNRTLTVVITRDDDHINPYTVFGYNEDGVRTNNGDGTPAIVTINQSSFNQVLRDMASNPFVTTFCRYKTDNELNLNNPIRYRRKDSTGFVDEKIITPIDYLEPNCRFEENGLIYIPDFNGLLFDGAHELTGDIEEDSEIILVLTIKSKVQIGKAANGEPVLSINNNPAPGAIRNVPVIVENALGAQQQQQQQARTSSATGAQQQQQQQSRYGGAQQQQQQA